MKAPVIAFAVGALWTALAILALRLGMGVSRRRPRHAITDEQPGVNFDEELEALLRETGCDCLRCEIRRRRAALLREADCDCRRCRAERLS